MKKNTLRGRKERINFKSATIILTVNFSTKLKKEVGKKMIFNVL